MTGATESKISVVPYYMIFSILGAKTFAEQAKIRL